MPQLVERLKEAGVLRSESIERALLAVDRADFLPEVGKSFAYEDAPLPIGEGQTISQPYTVVFMLEALEVEPGNTVLDVGSGSGWQTALLTHLVGEKGRVYAFEVVEKLCTQGRENVEKYKELARRVEFFCKNAKEGYSAAAPFERIIAAAEVNKVPEAWRAQLAAGGRLLYPKNKALVLERKNADGTFEVKEFPGFAFVPFV